MRRPGPAESNVRARRGLDPFFRSPSIAFAFAAVHVGMFHVCNVIYLIAAGLMLTAVGLRGISGRAGGGNA